MERAGMTARVLNEIDVHWQLHHPSLLRLHTFFEDERWVYLVMELCRRGELYRYLQRRGNGSLSRLSEPEARWVLMQIVNG